MTTHATRNELKPEVFDRFCEIVYDQAGISLAPGKEALVQARVGKRMRTLGVRSFDDYLDHLERDMNGNELTLFLDAICTNVTSFFREEYHFDFISRQLTSWLEQGQRRFRFWSAACSSGEEPLSLAMTAAETAAGFDGIDMRILATDISTRVLDRCTAARYPVEKTVGVPAEQHARWFEPAGTENGQAYCRPKKELQDMIVYRRLNLSTPPFPMRGPLDVVMCRNVMIYFDNPVRERLLAEIHRLLIPGGYLIVGHAESLNGIPHDLRYVAPSIYVKRP